MGPARAGLRLRWAFALGVGALGVGAFVSPARANAPAPWGMCRGAKEGDPCDSHYYPRGLCVREADAQCPDGEKSAGGVCLYCLSGADKSFARDAVPAAMAGLGLIGLVGVALVRRR